MSIDNTTIGDLLRDAEAIDAGSVSASFSDADGNVVWAVVVIRGDGAGELLAAWDDAHDAVHNSVEAATDEFISRLDRDLHRESRGWKQLHSDKLLSLTARIREEQDRADRADRALREWQRHAQEVEANLDSVEAITAAERAVVRAAVEHAEASDIAPTWGDLCDAVRALRDTQEADQ